MSAPSIIVQAILLTAVLAGLAMALQTILRVLRHRRDAKRRLWIWP